MPLDDVPSWLASAWDISEASAQIILSIVVIFAVLLPVLLLARGRNGITIHLLTFFLAESFLVGIGWLPFWMLILTLCIVALAVASVGAKAITGG